VRDAAASRISYQRITTSSLYLLLTWTAVPDLYVGQTKYEHLATKYNVRNPGDTVPGLAVPAGNLAFSVIVFSVCACICVASLAIRRKLSGAELGGPGRLPLAGFLGFLWVLYILMSYLQIYGHI